MIYVALLGGAYGQVFLATDRTFKAPSYGQSSIYIKTYYCTLYIV